MEQWKTEIKRLNKMRLDLGLNMNQLEKLTGVNRSRLKGFFEFTNEPRISFYFLIKNALEKEIEVLYTESKKATNFVDSVIPMIKLKDKSLIKDVEVIHSEPKFIEIKVGFNDCGCKMEDNLFKRDKNCKMKKQLHKF